MVSRDAAARVREVAEELSYVPNPFARSLRVQDSRTLGLLVPDNTNPFFAEVAKSIEAACFRAGYTLILCNTDRSLDKEAAQARVLYEKRVDGVLMFNTSDGSADTIAWLIGRSTPVVLLERRASGTPVDAVVSDNVTGVRLAMDHLASMGHRRIACLNGDRDVSHYVERRAAYVEAVRALDLVDDPDYIQEGLVGYADGEAAATTLLGLAHPPTALFCFNDTLAIGAMRGLDLAGMRTPEDVAVVGYGDTLLASYARPTLTSVVQDKPQVAVQAVRLVLSRIVQRAAGEEWQPRTYVVPTRLVVRDSSYTVRAGGQASPSRTSAKKTRKMRTSGGE